MKKIFKNLTPHQIVLNDGTIYETEGVARVSATFSEFSSEGVCSQEFGEITGLPESRPNSRDSHCCLHNKYCTACGECGYGTYYIVSGLVLAAAQAAGRTDCVAPATGHPETIRNESGHIVSVPGFVR